MRKPLDRLNRFLKIRRAAGYRDNQRKKDVARKRLLEIATTPRKSKITEYRPAKERFLQILEQLPQCHIDNSGEKFVFFDPPSDFSLFNNYHQTLSFLMHVRLFFSVEGATRTELLGKKFAFASFHKIKEIEPAAGLVLAAEMHRFKETQKRKPESYDHIWERNVTDFFHEVGLFDLLDIVPHSVRSDNYGVEPVKTLKIMFGRDAAGERAFKIRESIKELCGKNIKVEQELYDALIEAMANVVDHAYPERFRTWPEPQPRLWWLTASWMPIQGKVKIIIFDQGIGIPQTLKRQRGWRNALKAMWRESSDAGLIRAAMDYGRSGTLKTNRGKGLPDMFKLTKRNRSGYLRILSGSGGIVVYPNGDISMIENNVPFLGTLVEWEVDLNG